MSCISLSNEESLIYVLVSWVFHNVHFGILQAQNAISAYSSTGLIKSMILYILVLGLVISGNTTSTFCKFRLLD